MNGCFDQWKALTTRCNPIEGGVGTRMYESFYRLRKTPFRLTPDPSFFFESRTHKRGAAYLCYAMQQGEGFVVITGKPGTGKTELMLNLIREFDDPHVVFAKIVSTNVNADDFLALVAASFGLSSEGLGKGILLKTLENFFIACARQDKQVFLLIDEAHNLSTTSLTELSMLSNFQLGEKAILRCFLLGQESLAKKLEKPKLAHLKQRVIASAHLDPMNEAETAEYIKHRLTLAGWRGDPRFHDDAYPLIYKFTGGIPRQINFFCHRLLLQGYIDELHKIDAGVVRGVIKELLEETTVAHAPCNPDEHFTVPFPNTRTSVRQRNRLHVANMQKPRTSAPLLKVVANQALAIKPESTFPATEKKSTGSALITSPANLADADVLQELARDGARRLLRMLTQDSQADRELRASVAFYIRTESARLMSPDSIRQLNATIPVAPAHSPPVRTSQRLSSAGKWAAVASIAVFAVIVSPQLQHTDKPVIPANSADDSKATNRLTVAMLMPIGENRISASGPVTIIDSPQSNNSLTTLGISLADIVTEANPPSTTKATEQLTVEQHKLPETNNALRQKKEEKKAENMPIRLANNNKTTILPQTAKPPSQSLKTRPPPEHRKPVGISNTPAVVFPLSPPPSLAPTKPAKDQSKPVTPSATPKQTPVTGNPVESTTTETDIPAADLKILLSRLTSAYEAGNLRKLVSVFAENAHSNNKTSLNAIEDDYRKLFDVTDMRKMMISNIQWEKIKNRMRGKGNFQLVVREKGAGRVTSYDGSIEFDVAQSTRGIVITQLDYRYD